MLSKYTVKSKSITGKSDLSEWNRSNEWKIEYFNKMCELQLEWLKNIVVPQNIERIRTSYYYTRNENGYLCYWNFNSRTKIGYINNQLINVNCECNPNEKKFNGFKKFINYHINKLLDNDIKVYIHISRKQNLETLNENENDSRFTFYRYKSNIYEDED